MTVFSAVRTMLVRLPLVISPKSTVEAETLTEGVLSTTESGVTVFSVALLEPIGIKVKAEMAVTKKARMPTEREASMFLEAVS